MFTNTQGGGLNFGFPDVCLTPALVPVPIPYPNFSMPMTALVPTTALKVFTSGMPTHNMMTTVPMSMGDNAGVSLGVLSGMVMGPTRHLLGSFSVLIGGMPATKMTSMTGQNGMSMNAPGLSLVPCQFKCMILR